MANVSVDYFFSLASPFTYMGHERFEALAKKYGAQVSYKPADYGKVFAATGGVPVKQRSPQRQAYRFMELKRWRDHLKIPLNLEPKFFPVNDGPAACMVIAAQRAGRPVGGLVLGFLRAVWAEERDIADPETIRAIVQAAGLDAGALLKAAEDPAIAAEREANTEEGIRRGVFGAPTWIIRDELFWGQDRLEFVEKALAKG
jgi:2-hydroxychromene-2-carboxylate isomerase